MPLIVDELSPDYVGQRKLTLSLADPLVPTRAFTAIDITVDAAKTEPEGLLLPLEMLVTAPSPDGFTRRFYRKSIPNLISFTPREGGEHLVVLREVGHNRWWGSLRIEVAGEVLDPRATQ